MAIDLYDRCEIKVFYTSTHIICKEKKCLHNHATQGFNHIKPITNNTGIGNVNTIPKIANLPPGNNTQIVMKNKNIANPNATTLKGMEKSQLGNVIPGKQGTTFEGQQLGNNASTRNAGNNDFRW